MFDKNIKDAVWALDRIEKGRPIDNPDEMAKMLIWTTKIIRLHELKDRLKSGWGKYVYDRSMSVLGENPVYRLRNSRSIVLGKLSSLPKDQFDSIKDSLKEELVSLRVFDFEPESRPEFFKIINNIVSENIRFFKANISSPIPVSILISDDGKMLISMDRFVLPEAAVKEFENENDAKLFFADFIALLLHCKENGLVEPDKILADKFAQKYSREIYKVFHRSIKKEDKIAAGNYIRDGKVWEAAGMLMEHNSFYRVFKNLPNMALVSFGAGILTFSSFVGNATFTFNEYAMEKMLDAFSRNKKSAREFFMAGSYLYFTLVEYFMDKRVYLSRDLEPILPDDAGWALPVTIDAECTVDSESKQNVDYSLFGIKNIEIETSDSKFIRMTKSPEDFRIKPIDHTLINVQAYNLPDSDEIYRGAIYYSPEIFYLLNLMMVRRKLDGSVIAELNPRIPRKFSFVREGKKSGIVSRITDKIAAVPSKTSRRAKK